MTKNKYTEKFLECNSEEELEYKITGLKIKHYFMPRNKKGENTGYLEKDGKFYQLMLRRK